MANFVRIGIVLVVVLAVFIVDSTPRKTAASIAASQKENNQKANETVSKLTSKKGLTGKTAALKKNSKKVSTNKKTGSKASAKKSSTAHAFSSQSQPNKAPPQDAAAEIPTAHKDSIQNEPASAVTSSISSILSNSQALPMLARLQTGNTPTSGELLSLMLPDLLSGAKTLNPALSSLASALNETSLALKASKDGKLSTGQMMICSNKILTALGNATDTPKEKMPKLKACMATGMRTFNSSDLSTVFGTLNDCSQFLGNGTASGDVAVMTVMSSLLPPGVGGLMKNPGVQNVMNAVGSIVSQVAANPAKNDVAPSVDAPSLMNSLGSMAKGAGLNIDFGQMFSNFKFGR